MPLDQLKKRRINKNKVTHLSKTMRESIREIESILPCERTICNNKVELSLSHGTETKNFFF